MAALGSKSKLKQRVQQDSSVNERRLRQIYDWLDNGNYKNALQEANKVLKKKQQFDLHCVLVLKALALLRLGREDECKEILESVRGEIPTDDQTLQAMTIIYRETQQLSRICELYDAAVQKDPTNEDILTHLFMAHVRMGNYNEQQTVAMRLYKLRPKNPYYFWAVMSVVMQAYHSDDKIAQMVKLPIAERMVEKFIAEDKIEAEQEVQLYLMILEKQGKLREALNVIEGPLGERLSSYISVPQKKANLYLKLKLWKESIVLHKNLLKEDLDQWSAYKGYLTSAMSLLDEKDVPPSSDIWERCDISPQQIMEFLEFILLEVESNGKKLRGPYLARLELYMLLKEKGKDAEQITGGIIKLFVDYFRLFGDRSCCPSDLKPYLQLLSTQQQETLFKEVWQIVGLEDGELPDTVRRMQQQISIVLLSRLLGYHERLSSLEKLQLSTCLLRYYQNGMRFNLEPLPTDFLSNDPYVVLMVHLLLDVWFETQISDVILDAILLLEHALVLSPSNFHFKLLLLKCYHILGAGRAAHDVYQSLDVKHMQLDSLGYIHCGITQTTGQIYTSIELYNTTLRFFTVNYKDSVDYLSYTYKFGSFVKIEEFVEFRERLSNSYHYATVTVEHMLIDILHSTHHSILLKVIPQMDIEAEKDKSDCAKMTDNRDLHAYVSWDPIERQVNDDVVKNSRNADIKFLKLRMLLLRGIGAAVALCLTANDQDNNVKTESCKSPIVNGKKESTQPLLASLEGLASELSNVLESTKCDLPQIVPPNIIGAPFPSRLFAYVKSNSIPLQIELFKLIIKVAHGIDQSQDLVEAGQRISELLGEAVKSLIVDVVSEREVDPLANRRDLLERIVITVEMVTITALAGGVVHNLFTPTQHFNDKKAKKKNNVVAETLCPKIVESFNKIVEDVQGLIKELEWALSAFQSRVSVEPSHKLIESLISRRECQKPESKKSCPIPAIGVLPASTSEDVNTLTSGMAELFLSTSKDRKIKEYCINISAKLKENYDESLQEIRTLVLQKVGYLDAAKL